MRCRGLCDSWGERDSLAGRASHGSSHVAVPNLHLARAPRNERGRHQTAVAPLDVHGRRRHARAVRAHVPLGHADGSAGSRWISPAWLCSSISAMPAVAPKLPSIWNGGCASNRFGVDAAAGRSSCRGSRAGRSRLVSSSNAWSPSPSRAQKLIFHAIDQPVASSPRSSSERRAAAKSSGVRSGVISRPGMHAEQMRDVAMVRLGSVEVLRPFQELATLRRFGRDQPRARLLELARGTAASDSERRRRFDRVGEEIPESAR